MLVTAVVSLDAVLGNGAHLATKWLVTDVKYEVNLIT